VTPASAADLGARYNKAAPMMAPVYDWSGFYLGVNGGYGSSRKCWDATASATAAILPASAEGCHDATGGTFGGQIGYRWQASSWVFGLEAQGNWADFSGSNVSTSPLFAGNVNRSRVDSFGLFTGQIGYAWNNTLLYVKGGAAVTSDRYDTFIASVPVVTGREDRWGSTVGVGLEYGLSPNWTVGVEYDHMFMGNRNVNFRAVPGGAFDGTERIRQDVDLITARINYKWGGPVAARY
jgi:outer membrane immunogenic protein